MEIPGVGPGVPTGGVFLATGFAAPLAPQLPRKLVATEILYIISTWQEGSGTLVLFAGQVVHIAVR
ncbi:hypothetical protein QNH10_15255 [Sporosarcina thermotolerans]|nr:hypothetical protein [Sporosarcina thermotolerans]WHT47510.1 hypothetical protein QNH10_15255 [Sporosarcina thermotolerans]